MNRERLGVKWYARVPFHVRHICETVNESVLQQLQLSKAQALTETAN